MTVKLCAIAATREPTPNSSAAMSINCMVSAFMQLIEQLLEYPTNFLPNVWLRAEMTGWTTAEAMRNEVPDQKASMAVPWSLSVIVGRVMLREVASSAAARVTTQIDVKANKNALPALKEGCVVVVLVGTGADVGAGAGGVSERDRSTAMNRSPGWSWVQGGAM